MNSANNALISNQAKTLLRVTQEHWLCSAKSTHKRTAEASVPASTTAPAAHAAPQATSLHPNDPYPTWPFTRVNPADLERWCKKNVPRKQWPEGDIEEALM